MERIRTRQIAIDERIETMFKRGQVTKRWKQFIAWLFAFMDDEESDDDLDIRAW